MTARRGGFVFALVALLGCGEGTDSGSGPAPAAGSTEPRGTAEGVVAPAATGDPRPPRGTASEVTPLFVDVTAASGVTHRNTCGAIDKQTILESLGAGLAVFDADGDGDQDLFLANGATIDPPANPADAPRPAFYLNDGSARFRDATAGAGLGAPAWWHGAAAADYDGDGRTDLLVTAWGRQTLYRNRGVEEGTPRFDAVAVPARVDGAGWSTSAAFADLDRDGDLDLYVCHYITFDPKTAPRDCPWKGMKAFCGPEGLVAERDAVYRNEGDGTFADVTQEWGFDPGGAFYALGVVVADYDGDGDPDVYVGNDSQRNLLFRNVGDGRVEEIGVLSGVAYGDEGTEQASMGVDAGDYDGDGDFDLFVTNFEGDYSTLYRNDGEMAFTDNTIPAGLERVSWADLGWSTRFFDYDHDGDDDLFSANGHVYPLANRVRGISYEQENELFRNDGGKFFLANAEAGDGWKVRKSYRGGAVGDLDEDGDLDLVFTCLDDLPTVLRNDGADARSWIRFLLEGRRSSREAVGALLVLEAGGRKQFDEVRANTGYLSSHDPRVHFGLGASERVERLVVRWPSGREEVFGPLAARSTWRLREGSTPEPASAASR